MNRDEMIETAARAEHQHGLDIGAEYCEWEALPANMQNQYLNSVRAALDAILPQIITVEELEALPGGSVVVGRDGSPFEVGHEGGMWNGDIETGNYWTVIAGYAPLTVVYRP